MSASAVPSRRLLGRYEIVAEIASGGMGTVFLARLEGVGGFQRLVAIKLMHRHLATEVQFTHMLLDEARLAAQLHHPNAVGVIDVAESDIGLYIVMEYVDGFALDRVLDVLRSAPEKRIRIGLRIWLDAVRGLSAAHRLRDEDGNPLGIVHRDVSPQNILVGVDGAGRITDFGVARAAARITSSHPGMIKGKPCYMAPEQARASEVDARADTFALGIVLWEILAGRMLFDIEGGAAATLLRVINDPIPLPSTVTPEAAPLDEVCAKGLERDLETRYQSGRRQFEAVEVAARAAGLLATQEEVADFMHEAFASEMNERKSAIKAHLSAIRGADASVMQQSDVFAVPSLNNKTPSEAHTSAERPTQKVNGGESGPWHEASESSRKAMKRPPADQDSGVSSEEALAVTTLAPQSPVGEPPKPPRWKALAVVLAVGGVLMAGIAAWVISNSNAAESAAAADEAAAQARAEQEQDEAVEREHAQALAEAAEREAAARAAAASSADEARAAREAVESAREASASAAEESAQSERSARRRASMGSGAMSAETTMGDTTMDDTAMDNTAATMQTTMQPAFENNPYLR